MLFNNGNVSEYLAAQQASYVVLGYRYEADDVCY